MGRPIQSMTLKSVRSRERYAAERERQVARVTAYHEADLVRRNLAQLRFRLKAYGLTVDEFVAIKVAQGGVCALCREPERRLSKNGRLFELVVDHDHVTGVVRGLLCHSCNVAIGHFRDNPVLALRAADYLLSSGKGGAEL